MRLRRGAMEEWQIMIVTIAIVVILGFLTSPHDKERHSAVGIAATCLAESPTGDAVAVGFGDGHIEIVDKLGKTIRSISHPLGNDRRVDTLFWTKADDRLRSLDDEGKFCRWNPYNGELEQRINLGELTVGNQALSQDGIWLASSGSDYRDAEIVNTKTGKRVQLSTAQPEVSLFAFRPGTNELVGAVKETHDLMVWQVSERSVELTRKIQIPHEIGELRKLVVSASGKVAVAGFSRLCVLSQTTGDRTRIMYWISDPQFVRFVSNEHALLVADNRDACIQDIDTLGFVERFPLKGKDQRAQVTVYDAMLMTGNGKLIAATDQGIQIFTAEK